MKVETPAGSFAPSTVKIPTSGYLTLPFPTPTNEQQFLEGWKKMLSDEIAQRQEWLRMVERSLDELKHHSAEKNDGEVEDEEPGVGEGHDVEGDEEMA